MLSGERESRRGGGKREDRNTVTTDTLTEQGWPLLNCAPTTGSCLLLSSNFPSQNTSTHERWDMPGVWRLDTELFKSTTSFQPDVHALDIPTSVCNLLQFCMLKLACNHCLIAFSMQTCIFWPVKIVHTEACTRARDRAQCVAALRSFEF